MLLNKKNQIYFYLHNPNILKLKYLSFKLQKLIELSFIYNLNSRFVKFPLFSFQNATIIRSAVSSGPFALLKSPHVNKKAQNHYSKLYYKLRFCFNIIDYKQDFFLINSIITNLVFRHLFKYFSLVSCSHLYLFYYLPKSQLKLRVF